MIAIGRASPANKTLLKATVVALPAMRAVNKLAKSGSTGWI
jgi:hypothetical protein